MNRRGPIKRCYLDKFGQNDRLGLTPEIIEIMRTLEDVTSVSSTVTLQQVMPWAVREGAYLFPLDWMRVNNIGKLPGSILGSIRSHSFGDNLWKRMAEKLRAWDIEGLVVIAGLKELKLAGDF